jgi:hypothetical protein
MWYFRFKLPGRLRSLAGRSELRISLGTRELTVARQRAEGVLADVYLIKQLARHMSVLEPSQVQKALHIAFSEIVEKLEQGKEPWMRARAAAPFGLVSGSSVKLHGGFGSDVRHMITLAGRIPLGRY